MPRSGIRRVWQVLTGLAGLVIVVVVAVPAGQSGLAGLLLLPVGVALSVVMVRQPGAFVYVDGERVGLHTTFRTRYEVAVELVHVVRVTTVVFFGVRTRGLVLEAADGRRLLTHANATYDETDLERLAERIGATLADEEA
jgi:hypothetical protein